MRTLTNSNKVKNILKSGNFSEKFTVTIKSVSNLIRAISQIQESGIKDMEIFATQYTDNTYAAKSSQDEGYE